MASGHTAVVLLLLLLPCGVKWGVVPIANRSQSSSSRDMLGLVAIGHPKPPPCWLLLLLVRTGPQRPPLTPLPAPPELVALVLLGQSRTELLSLLNPPSVGDSENSGAPISGGASLRLLPLILLLLLPLPMALELWKAPRSAACAA